MPADDEFAIMPVIPLIDMGFYGQFSLGTVKLGAGIRGFSIILINVFWPSVYAELNMWRFTVSAQLGGGLFYLFPIFVFPAPYFLPELSLWYTVSKFGKNDQLRIGAGVMTLFSPESDKKELFRDFSTFSQNTVFYVAIKVSFFFPVMTWKRVL
jgi:hypothetical protein